MNPFLAEEILLEQEFRNSTQQLKNQKQFKYRQTEKGRVYDSANDAYDCTLIYQLT